MNLPTSAKGLKGWRKLITDIAKALNNLHITPGAGINVSDSGTGVWVISAIVQGSDDTSTSSGGVPSASGAIGGGGGGGGANAKTPDGVAASWQQIEVFDSSCQPFTMWVWGAFKT
jgi:hypothetical protein